MSTPLWLQVLAIVSLSLAGLSALTILVAVIVRPQHMGIMNWVWPITALWAGPLALWAYYRWGRDGSHAAHKAAKARGKKPPNYRHPFPIKVMKGATHCGAGCTLGDIFAEWLIVLVPLILFGHLIFGAWAYDYILAFSFGIAFQYFTIAPMRGLGVGAGLREALKADTLSLTAWQIGMYGWMAIVVFAIFGRELAKTGPVFWFMMQIAMFARFITSYPVNWWLLRRGIKEAM
jgi:hypothetical protein